MPVSQEDLYTDEDGDEYLSTGSLQDDKRVYRTDDGTPYVERSLPVRLLGGGVGAAAVLVGVFFLTASPTVAAYGRWGGLLALVNALPAGHLVTAALGLVFGALMLRFAYTGRDTLVVE